jgi:23S rRNA (guanosine2251-2'-O)-methyltransferase
MPAPSLPDREDPTEAIIAGRNPVREALMEGAQGFEKVLIQQGAGGKAIEEVRRAAAAAGVPVQYVPPARLNRLAPGVNHQGVIAIVTLVGYVDVDEMLNQIAPDRDAVVQRRPVVVVLDRIEDPHNFGAILRTALAAGVGGVIVPVHQMAPLNAAAIKASAGTALRIPVARVTNIASTLHQLKERGYWVVGASGGGETSVWEMDWERPLVVVIGSESSGMRPRVEEACDYRVFIPIRGPVESLNASVAAGIVLFAATRTRG